MPFSLEEQLRLHGPANFEELCDQLVKREFPNSHHVRGAGGDQGLDIFDGELDPERRAVKGEDLRVWQVKCFRDGVKHGQREQVEKSLARVLRHRPRFWTLCIPVNLDVHGHQWWESLKAGHPGITFELWKADEIVRRVQQDRSLLETWFLLPQPPIAELGVASNGALLSGKRTF